MRWLLIYTSSRHTHRMSIKRLRLWCDKMIWCIIFHPKSSDQLLFAHPLYTPSPPISTSLLWLLLLVGWLMFFFQFQFILFYRLCITYQPFIIYSWWIYTQSFFIISFQDWNTHTHTHTRSATKCSQSHTIHCIVIKAHMCTQYDIVDSNEQDKAQKPVGWEYTHTTEHIA